MGAVRRRRRGGALEPQWRKQQQWKHYQSGQCPQHVVVAGLAAGRSSCRRDSSRAGLGSQSWLSQEPGKHQHGVAVAVGRSQLRQEGGLQLIRAADKKGVGFKTLFLQKHQARSSTAGEMRWYMWEGCLLVVWCVDQNQTLFSLNQDTMSPRFPHIRKHIIYQNSKEVFILQTITVFFCFFLQYVYASCVSCISSHSASFSVPGLNLVVLCTS